MSNERTIPLIPRRTFFENASASSPQLSPDGRWLAWLAAVDGVMNIWVAPRDDLTRARALTRQTDRPIFTHWFARTNEHVLFLKDRDGDENYNLWCVGLDGAARNLTPCPDLFAILLGMHHDDPHLVAVGMNDRDARWHDLYIVDIRTGERRLVYENTDEIASFVVDSALRPRLAATMRDRGSGSAILKWSGAAFEEAMSIEADDVLVTEPLHVNRAGDAWFLRSSVGRDKAVVFRVDWTTGTRTLIASHEKADISGWMIDPRTYEVTAACAEYIRDEWIVVDPAVGRDLMMLERELDATIEIESQSDDGALWVVGVKRPDRPYSWRLLDRRSGAITFLFSARPKLDEAKLAPMHGVVIKARDGLDLVCYLTLPASETGARPAHPLPMVVLVHGGPWARDSWRYNRDVQWLANRNYAVLQVNFRGSAGFGKAFTRAGDREWGGKMHDDLIDAVNWSIEEGVADPERIAIYGASYGGYAAFVGAAFTPDVFCCSVPVVGITNLETMLANPPPYWTSFYEQECHRIGDPRTPDGVALLKARSPLHRAGDITRPMLIGHGANDVRCKVSESDQIVAAMAEKHVPVIYVVYPDEGHGFDRPGNDIAFKAVMELFLARYLGGRAEPVGDDLDDSSHEIRAGGAVLQEILAGATSLAT
ncbi:S9 family peptidase [Methylocystis sp. WRRC1]|uniref:S9 family peptidase n=1 Tax=Methylocystis sp. WRRC1 TaxID=1732014 RepID=UPI001D13BA3A|nr:S9 family peptidase [Methylocystis sp. WRRC1]MCC3246468.1 S9 family peptidase [Methylocystis sp. WRRC1]